MKPKKLTLELLMEMARELGKIEPVKKPIALTFCTSQVTPELVKELEHISKEDIEKAIKEFIRLRHKLKKSKNDEE